MSDKKQESLRQAALSYHEFPKPGKLEIRATKPMANGRDLAGPIHPVWQRPQSKFVIIQKQLENHGTGQFGCGHFKRICRFGIGQHWCAGVKTRDGR